MLFVLIPILLGLLVKHAENVERLQSVILANATITITMPQMIKIIKRQDLVMIKEVWSSNLVYLFQNVLQLLRKQQLSSVCTAGAGWIQFYFRLIACESYFPHRWWAFIPAVLQINAKLFLLSNPLAAQIVSRWITLQFNVTEKNGQEIHGLSRTEVRVMFLSLNYTPMLQTENTYVW